MMKPLKADIELYRAFQKSPLLWIEKNFGLIPQPLKAGIKNDLPYQDYKEDDFEDFINGKHLTWQQWLFFRAIEWAIQGKAQRWISVRSGHGIGKTSALALLILWFLFCFKNSQIPCTAPTADQLKDVLWKEISLWIGRMKPEIAKLYNWQDQYVRIVENPEAWFARARTGRKENTEALAGVHGKHILMIADEASAVDEAVFETAEGALTNTDILVILIGNPTRLSGYFFETHHKNKRFWQLLKFSAEDSPIVPKEYCKRWEEKYGKESPQYDVRVRGEFPEREEDQFIPFSLFDAASTRQNVLNLDSPRIGGTDVARYGDDATVHTERQGNKAILLSERRGQDTMATCGDIVKYIKQGILDGNPYDFWCIDIIGLGSGVFDRLKELQQEGAIPKEIKLVPVNVSLSPLNDKEYSSRRAELADTLRKWLTLGQIDERFREQACSIKFKAPDSRGRLVIEKKEEMKERGLDSPDRFDSLVLTFSINQVTRERLQERIYHKSKVRKSSTAWWK